MQRDYANKNDASFASRSQAQVTPRRLQMLLIFVACCLLLLLLLLFVRIYVFVCVFLLCVYSRVGDCVVVVVVVSSICYVAY